MGEHARNGDVVEVVPGSYTLTGQSANLLAGRRLAASYANFLIINGAVLMPVYDDAADTRALAVMQQAFPATAKIVYQCA